MVAALRGQRQCLGAGQRHRQQHSGLCLIEGSSALFAPTLLHLAVAQLLFALICSLSATGAIRTQERATSSPSTAWACSPRSLVRDKCLLDRPQLLHDAMLRWSCAGETATAEFGVAEITRLAVQVKHSRLPESSHFIPASNSVTCVLIECSRSTRRAECWAISSSSSWLTGRWVNACVGSASQPRAGAVF